MAQFTKKEFTKIFEISGSEFDKLIKKKLLIFSNDNYIDIDNEVNLDWISKNKMALLVMTKWRVTEFNDNDD